MDTPSQTARRIDDNIRMPSNDEIAHYRDQGWVRLEGLLVPELADELAHTVAEIMKRGLESSVPGEDDRDKPHNQQAQGGLVGGEQGRALAQEAWHRSNVRLIDDFMLALATSRALGEAYSRLLGVRPLRLFSDTVFGLPSTSRGLSRPGTRWHQDYPWVPIDRAIGGNLWIPCVEILPDMGSLQYLSGSHHERPLGKHFGSTWEVGADSVYPWIMDKYEVSPAFHLQPGDALAHQLLTIHSSQPNRSESRDRIAWATQRIDAGALYDDKAHPTTDRLDLSVDQPLDDPLFPVVTDTDVQSGLASVRLL